MVDSLGRGLGTVLGTALGAAKGAALEPTRAIEPIRPNRRATPHPSTNNAVQTTANIAKCLPSFPEILILCLFKGCFLDFQLQIRKSSRSAVVFVKSETAAARRPYYHDQTITHLSSVQLAHTFFAVLSME